jgi:trk system potassium uptake protein TrkA
MLLAVTSKDEVNLIASMTAKGLGVRYAVARISNPEYYGEGSVLSSEQMGIDLMINPERECARETFDLLRSEIATDVVPFAEGRVQLVGLKVKEGAPVHGKSIAQLAEELHDHNYSTVAIVRDGKTEIPRSDSIILAGDQLYLLSPTGNIEDIAPLAGYEHSTLQRVMIAGGSTEGEHLAEILLDHGIECTILERDRRRCFELAERLPKALVLHGDATDLELLEMEGVAGIDGFVVATNSDETNLLSSLLAKSAGAPKVVSLVHKFEYLRLVPRVGVDATVSSRMSTVNAILRYVRRGKVVTVATLTGTDAEAIEFTVDETSDIAGQTVRGSRFPKNAVIGAIVRGDQVIVPRGDDEVLVGDEVIVFALPDAMPEVEKLFA